MPLITQNLNLSLRQTSEAEHPNLGSDMVPGARGATSLEALAQTGAHFLDAPTHSAEVIFPLSEEDRVIKDAAGDAGAVGWRVGDLRALQDSELAGNVAGSSCTVGARRRHKVESAGALAVQAEVLGEGLRDAQLEALFDEVADCP